jgi:DNA-binding NtrC family response regulator
MDDPELWRELAAGAPRATVPAEVAEPFDPSSSFRVAKERATSRWEHAYIEALVRSTGGNVSAAARAARMDRNYLRELLRKHGITIRDE